MIKSSRLFQSYKGKKVLVTGHTGFKGAWLCEWLMMMGAEVHGLALDPLPDSLFSALRLDSRLASDTRADIANLPEVVELISRLRPDFLFHLAAQPLVRLSYREPVSTIMTNVIGTVHLLEALRITSIPCVAIMVTTDKCYENREWLHAYREEDPMGGYDPYSASKGAAEILIASYRQSFFSQNHSETKIASVRAGNVIGGGDWAEDRIVPDCFRALKSGEAISVRNKTATRPWQHVLEPLAGYLWLGSCLDNPKLINRSSSADLESAFNFGPSLSSNKTVADLVQELLKHVPGEWIDRSTPDQPHEAGKLNLATDKAFHILGWKPLWNFEETVARTAQWYKTTLAEADPVLITRAQINDYLVDASSSNLIWAEPLK